MKKFFLFLTFAALLIGATSCKKNCYCTATDSNGKSLDTYTFEGLTNSECEEKVEEASSRAISRYGAQAMVGVQFSCSHM
ncbi:MAG: hypothetical protein MJZ72_07870 [Bacteroidales bacterium]|nr:hypothetical protein [Bacteroidales bacterium]